MLDKRKIAAIGVASLAGVLTATGASAGGTNGAASQGGEKTFGAQLSPVAHDPARDAGSNATGAAELSLLGRSLTTELTAAGTSANLPHAMHIHGARQAANECPGPDRRDDITDDGLIETAEGQPDYGPVKVSFTTSGDTSPGSTFALDRFPVADAGGSFAYERSFQIPGKLASRLGDLHIVVHGHDLNGNGSYDGPNSALGVPLEAELPVACGTISPTSE
ncbi:MAG: hypothetical protein ACRDOM_06660 [Nocardioides sp.]